MAEDMTGDMTGGVDPRPEENDARLPETGGDASRQAARESGEPKTSASDERPHRAHRNPPHTTEGFLTAPEFGAAGSGGAEYEPGPETD